MSTKPEIKTKFTLEGIKEAAGSLREFGRKANTAFSKVRSVGGKVFSPLNKGLKVVEKSIRKVSKELVKLGAKNFFRGMKLGAVGAAAGIGLVALKLTAISSAAIKASRDTSQMLDKISKDSRRTGVSTEDLSVLNFAAEREGVDPEEIIKGLSKIGKAFLNVREQIADANHEFNSELVSASVSAQNSLFASAKNGKVALSDISSAMSSYRDARKQALYASYSDLKRENDQAYADYLNSQRIHSNNKSGSLDGFRARAAILRMNESYQALKQMKKSFGPEGEALFTLENYGLNIEKATKGGTEALYEISDAFRQIQDPSEKTRVAMQLFGEDAGPKMITLLESGRKGIADYRKELERLGGVVSKADAELGASFEDSSSNLQRAIGGVKLEVSRSLLPLMIDTNKQITGWLVRSRSEIAKYFTATFISLRTFAMDVSELMSGDTTHIDTKWLDFLVQKIGVVRAVWADFKKQVGLLWEGKDTDYEWLNTLRDAFRSVKAFALDAWKVMSGGDAINFEWMNTFRDKVVAFTQHLKDAFNLFQSTISKIGDVLSPVLNFLNTDITTIGMYVGMLKMVGLLGSLKGAFGLLSGAAGATFSAGSAGAGGLTAALGGVGAAIGGVASAALALGTVIVGAFAAGQLAAQKFYEYTQKAEDDALHEAQVRSIREDNKRYLQKTVKLKGTKRGVAAARALYGDEGARARGLGQTWEQQYVAYKQSMDLGSARGRTAEDYMLYDGEDDFQNFKNRIKKSDAEYEKQKQAASRTVNVTLDVAGRKTTLTGDEVSAMQLTRDLQQATRGY